MGDYFKLDSRDRGSEVPFGVPLMCQIESNVNFGLRMASYYWSCVDIKYRTAIYRFVFFLAVVGVVMEGAWAYFGGRTCWDIATEGAVRLNVDGDDVNSNDPFQVLLLTLAHGARELFKWRGVFYIGWAANISDGTSGAVVCNPYEEAAEFVKEIPNLQDGGEYPNWPEFVSVNIDNKTKLDILLHWTKAIVKAMANALLSLMINFSFFLGAMADAVTLKVFGDKISDKSWRDIVLVIGTSIIAGGGMIYYRAFSLASILSSIQLIPHFYKHFGVLFLPKDQQSRLAVVSAFLVGLGSIIMTLNTTGFRSFLALRLVKTIIKGFDDGEGAYYPDASDDFLYVSKGLAAFAMGLAWFLTMLDTQVKRSQPYMKAGLTGEDGKPANYLGKDNPRDAKAEFKEQVKDFSMSPGQLIQVSLVSIISPLGLAMLTSYELWRQYGHAEEVTMPAALSVFVLSYAAMFQQYVAAEKVKSLKQKGNQSASAGKLVNSVVISFVFMNFFAHYFARWLSVYGGVMDADMFEPLAEFALLLVFFPFADLRYRLFDPDVREGSKKLATKVCCVESEFSDEKDEGIPALSGDDGRQALLAVEEGAAAGGGGVSPAGSL